MSKPTREDCIGCRDNWYNLNRDGGCWNLKTAKFQKARDIPIHMSPPYNHLPLTTKPNCYKADGYVRVIPEALRADGYWKA